MRNKENFVSKIVLSVCSTVGIIYLEFNIFLVRNYKWSQKNKEWSDHK